MTGKCLSVGYGRARLAYRGAGGVYIIEDDLYEKYPTPQGGPGFLKRKLAQDKLRDRAVRVWAAEIDKRIVEVMFSDKTYYAPVEIR